MMLKASWLYMIFQSTLSKRRATESFISQWQSRQISIHALQAESDFDQPSAKSLITDFNPRSPSGERPYQQRYSYILLFISIHALQAESDVFTSPIAVPASYFNPRSPSGERQVMSHQSLIIHLISIHALQAESD